MTRKPTNTPRIQHQRGMKAHTREEHDAIVAKRGRPVTDGPMREATRLPDGTPGNHSLIDEYLGGDAA